MLIQLRDDQFTNKPGQPGLLMAGDGNPVQEKRVLAQGSSPGIISLHLWVLLFTLYEVVNGLWQSGTLQTHLPPYPCIRTYPGLLGHLPESHAYPLEMGGDCVHTLSRSGPSTPRPG